MLSTEPRILNPDPGYPSPSLAAPTDLGYLYAAATVAPGSLLPFVAPSDHRERALATVRALADVMPTVDGVIDATVFRAIAIPPTAKFSKFLRAANGAIPVANFDLIVLVRCSSVEKAEEVCESPPYRQLLEALRAEAERLLVMVARNVRRIADVEIDRNGLFLFNHFAAARPAVLPGLWDRLAGWYVARMGLCNSVALAPVNSGQQDYPIVDWVRWDAHPIAHFAGMLCKPSFWRFVVANLDANHAASMPIYCRLA